MSWWVHCIIAAGIGVLGLSVFWWVRPPKLDPDREYRWGKLKRCPKCGEWFAYMGRYLPGNPPRPQYSNVEHKLRWWCRACGYELPPYQGYRNEQTSPPSARQVPMPEPDQDGSYEA